MQSSDLKPTRPHEFNLKVIYPLTELFVRIRVLQKIHHIPGIFFGIFNTEFR